MYKIHLIIVGLITLAFMVPVFCEVTAVDLDPGGNEEPVAVISHPSDELTYYEGEEILFDASNSTDEDTAVLSVHWSSSRDGYLGNLVKFHRALSGGEHEITLYVSDGENQTSAMEIINVIPVSGDDDDEPEDDDETSENEDDQEEEEDEENKDSGPEMMVLSVLAFSMLAILFDRKRN